MSGTVSRAAFERVKADRDDAQFTVKHTSRALHLAGVVGQDQPIYLQVEELWRQKRDAESELRELREERDALLERVESAALPEQAVIQLWKQRAEILEQWALRIRERADYLRYVWDNGDRGEKEMDAIVRSMAAVVADFDTARSLLTNQEAESR